MKVLIAYASKTGTAANCANMLAAELRGLQVTVVDLEKETPTTDGYDAVVLGSSVRFGKTRASFQAFLRDNQEALQQNLHGFFLCCGFGHEFERYEKKAIEESLRESAFAIMNFGGLLKLPNASFWERVFLRQVRADIRESEIEDGEYTPTLPGILPENISMMASHIRRAMAEIKRND